MLEKITRKVCERILTGIAEQQNLGSMGEPIRSDESGISILRYSSLVREHPPGEVCEGVQVTQGNPYLRSASGYSVRGIGRSGEDKISRQVLWLPHLERLCTKLKLAGLDSAKETTTEDGYPAVEFRPAKSTVMTVLQIGMGVQWGAKVFNCYAEAEDALRREGFAFLCISNGGDAELWTKLGTDCPMYAAEVVEVQSPIYWLRRLQGRVKSYYEDMLERDDFAPPE